MRALNKALRYKRHIIDPRLILLIECVGAGCLGFQIYNGIDSIISVIMWATLAGACTVTVLHRLLSHNSWPCPRWLRNTLSLFSVLLLQGAPIAWIAIHREHHIKCDTEGDPHSPLFKNRLWIQLCSMMYFPNFTYATDMLRDRWQKFLFDYYWVINICFGALLFYINPIHIVMWLAVSFVTQMSAYAVNSVCHDTPWYWLPSSEKSTNNASKNIWLLALVTGGESWHLNHHNEPRRWYFGKHWYQIDTSGIIIFFMILLTTPSYFFKSHKTPT